MSKVGRWFRRRFKELELLEQYFPLLFTRWQAALWGGSVLAVAFGWHFVTADWPYPVKVTACVTALFFAGYYLWRADHIRLQPQLTIATSAHLQETPVIQSHERRVFVQIEPLCMTDSPVAECRGHLLRVYNRWTDKEDWKLIDMRERLLLGWSHYGIEPITLYPSGGQYLNICWRSNNVNVIVPSCEPLPARWKEAFDNVGTYKFDIEVTAKDCSPVQASVLVNIDETEWNKPVVEVIPVQAQKEK
jgi:hypothetical protein